MSDCSENIAGIRGGICRQVVVLQYAVSKLLNHMDDTGLFVRAELHGRIEGLRYALCLVLGLDPIADPWVSAHEGPADDYVRAWHNEHCPRGADCEGPW